MTRLLRTVCTAGLVLALAACSLPRGAAIQAEVVNEMTSEDPTFQVVEVTRSLTPQIATWPRTGTHEHYHWFSVDQGPDSSTIRSGDRLDIVVWDNQVNSLISSGEKQTMMPTQTVSSNGSIFLPYVGDVYVGGLTSDSARDRIQTKMEMIVPSAQVQLSVKQGRNNSVDVASGVGAPGRYPLENRNTQLLSVLAMAGGVKESLRHPLVQLQRGGRTYETRMESVLSHPRNNVRVRGGDQLAIIEDTRTFNVLGASGRQEIINFEKEDINALEALSASGGLNAGRADPRGVLILREYQPEDLKPGMEGPDMQQVVFTIDLTSADGLFAARQFRVMPGDTLLATESPINGARTIMDLFGTVVGFGVTVNNLSE